MNKLNSYIIPIVATFFAFVPMLEYLLLGKLQSFNLTSVIMVNAIAWCLIIFFIYASKIFKSEVEKIAKNLSIDTRNQELHFLLSKILHEINRKNTSLSLNVLDQKIASKEELSKTLEKIVAIAYKLFSAEACELALFDKSSGLYHSSFVMGTPLSPSSQAMLSGALEGAENKNHPDVIVQPLSFAGSILGTLRVALKDNRTPTLTDLEIIKILSLQASFALINAQYTSELVRMKKSSDETLKAKTGFLANLSHEIRAPLGIMMNAVELTLDGLCGPINQDQTDTLKMVHTNGEHLLELINDVLDYAKVEAGKVQAQKVDIFVNDILTDVCNVVRSQVDAKKHKLTLKLNDEALAFSCDRRHIRQMLINLLSNAIKYTPESGSIEVYSERLRGDKIRISIKDNGVGIDSSDRDKVFSPFERVENSYSLSQVGTGLGMSLTRKLAEVNNGTVDFSSQAGKGSHFWLTFPAINAELASSIKESVNPLDTQGKGEHVLVVEKEDGERNMITRYLSFNGYKVVAVSGKEDATKAVKNNKFDIVVLDNNSLDLNDDIVKEIRDSQLLEGDPNKSSLNIPIVLVSSRAFIFDIEKYLKAGIDRCVIKPLKLIELSGILRELLDGKFSGEFVDDFEKTHKMKKQEPAQNKPTKLFTQVISLK